MKIKSTLIVLILFASSCIETESKKQTDGAPNQLASKKEIESTIEKSVDSSKYNRWFEPSSLDTSFVLKNGSIVHLKQTDSIHISEYFIPEKALDSLTALHNNWHKLSLALESYIFNQKNNHFYRDSNGLFLEMRNGEWKLVPLDEQNDEVDNTFEHHFTEFGFYSVRTQWGEGSGYKLINDNSGAITHLYGRPYFSPNGECVISVNVDIEANYSANGFQLFENKNGELIHLGNYQVPNSYWGPEAAKWLNDSTIILRNKSSQLVNNEYGYFYFYSKLKIKK